MPISASPELIEFVKGWESCQLDTYLDGGRVLTIGWGHTRGVRLGDTCTQAEADQWLADEIAEAGVELLQYMKRIPTQEQFDSLLSLGYNAGIGGAKGIGRAGIMMLFNKGDDEGCADRFLSWNKDGGVIVNGLTKRRRGERAIYMFADYSGRP